MCIVALHFTAVEVLYYVSGRLLYNSKTQHYTRVSAARCCQLVTFASIRIYHTKES